MRTCLIAIFFLLFYSAINAQKIIDRKSIDFISQIINYRRLHVYIVRNVYSYTIDEIKRRLSSDTIVSLATRDNTRSSDTLMLGNGEREKILSQLDRLKSFIWTKKNVAKINSGQSQLLDRDSIWKRVFDFSGKVFYNIIPPLFFKNGEYCLFYYDYGCGGLCGYGELAIYKKETNKWKRWKSIYSWIS